MSLCSPLRYPGGKACLADFLADVIKMNDLRGCDYYEPYAGGAGAALSLLRDGIVSRIFINDADERVSAFWKSALTESSRFADMVFSATLDIKEWRRQRDICANPRRHRRFDLGFAAFFMNRCNRSGVLTGAGPIGGVEQRGKWRLGVRFSKKTLAERIIKLGTMRDQIRISRLDAIDFLKTKVPGGAERKRVFVYLDPPYVNKGQRLYLNAYQERDHARLARYLKLQRVLPWIMSYDDTCLVRNLYVGEQVASLPIHYSLQKKRDAHELVIAPAHLVMPADFRIHGKESVFQWGIQTN